MHRRSSYPLGFGHPYELQKAQDFSKIIGAGGNKLRADAQEILWGHDTGVVEKERKFKMLVLTMPGLTRNIYTVIQALERGVRGSFEPGNCSLKRGTSTCHNIETTVTTMDWRHST